MIDTHVHFWRYTSASHAWIDPHMSVLKRDCLPRDLEATMRTNGVSGCIAVQALNSSEETQFLLDLADAHPWIVGVVGWVDVLAEDLDARLAELAAHPKLVGIRHLAQDEADAGWLARPSVVAGVSKLARHGLSFDLLVRERELSAAIELAQCLPNQTFVLDHLGKPPVREGRIEPWSALVRELARCDNVVAKVSGLSTERRSRADGCDDLDIYLDVALQAFGADRLMSGSDWPMCLLAGDYAASMDVARACPLVGGGTRARLRAYGV